MNRKILSVLCIFTLMLAITMPSQAATGYQGYAVYRDGVFDVWDTELSQAIEWHAAIFVEADHSAAYTYPVAHSVKSSGDGTRLGTWSEFRSGYSPKVICAPTSNLFSVKRDFVVTTARELASAEIEHTFLRQVEYDAYNNPYNQETVFPVDIMEIRCDGLVEYCYEFHNMRVSGNDNFWNISKWGSNYRSEHSGVKITPKDQALNYLTTVIEYTG